MSTIEPISPAAKRTLVGALHLTAYALVTATALRVLMTIANALDDSVYEQYGLDIDMVQRVASNIAEMTTLLPGLSGLVLLALLRHLGSSKETPGFFVALAVGGVMGVLLALAGIYDIVRLVTESFNEALLPQSGVAKVALGVSWLTTVVLGAASAYLTWLLWSDGSSETVTDEDSAESDESEATALDGEAPTLEQRDPSTT